MTFYDKNPKFSKTPNYGEPYAPRMDVTLIGKNSGRR
jgi:hypothetical protein